MISGVVVLGGRETRVVDDDTHQ